MKQLNPYVKAAPETTILVLIKLSKAKAYADC